MFGYMTSVHKKSINIAADTATQAHRGPFRKTSIGLLSPLNRVEFYRLDNPIYRDFYLQNSNMRLFFSEGDIKNWVLGS
jgi:hypothetical protein